MSSVANRDEAEKCVGIARQALRAGDRDKAIRWLNKSIRLYETSEATSLLSQLSNNSTASDSTTSSSSAAGSSPNAHTHTQQSTTTRRTTTTTTTDNDSKTSSVSYTEEELQVVTQIKQGKNHYEILGVSKTCDEKAIKVAYRKLAIKVHPDKNKAPGADDAFKLVSNAFQILSDSGKRKHYDMTGSDDANSSAAQQRAAYQQATRNAFYTNVEDDITPEDIFNMFFSGMAGVNSRPRQYQRTQRQYQSPFEQQRSAFYRAQQQQQHARAHQQQQPGGFNISQFLHFIPIILLVLFSMFSMPSTDDKPFSLHKSAQMPVHRQTKQWESPYYVDRSFISRYGRDPRAVHQVDQQVEQAWYNEYKAQCVNQQSAKQRAKEQARQAKGASQVEAIKRAEAMATDACQKATEQLKHV